MIQYNGEAIYCNDLCVCLLRDLVEDFCILTITYMILKSGVEIAIISQTYITILMHSETHLRPYVIYLS